MCASRFGILALATLLSAAASARAADRAYPFPWPEYEGAWCADVTCCCASHLWCSAQRRRSRVVMTMRCGVAGTSSLIRSSFAGAP